MRTPGLRAGLLWGCVGILASSVVVEGAATITLKAVKKNGVAIPGGPTTNVTGAVVGDTYECEFYVAGWNGTEVTLVRSYQFRVDGIIGAGFDPDHPGGAPGGILPVGWSEPFPQQVCSTNLDCHDPLYPVCLAIGTGGVCVGNTHNPALGAFVTTTIDRDDFILFGFSLFGGLSTDTLDYIFGLTALESEGTPDFGIDFYAGTLKLVVKANACGTYVWGTKDGSNNSFLVDYTPQQPQTALFGTPLTIHMQNACSAGITSTDPPVCTIDARYPNDPNNVATRFGFNTFTLNFNNDPGAVTAASFQMSVVPASGGTPVITNVAKNGNQVTLTFQNPIPSTKWSCAKALFGDQDVACIAALGADTDKSRTSEGADTLALMDALDGNPVLQVWQTDLDRSAHFSPLDILASIDLLNGAGALNVFKGASIPACPTVGIPIP